MSTAFASTAVGYRSDPSVPSLPLMLGTPLLFAANMVVARWAESAAIPPLFLAFGRWALAFVLLLPIAAPELWKWRHVLMANGSRVLLLASLGMGMAVAPQYIGARNTSAANVALIFAACPVFVTLIETVVWRMPLARMRIYGMALAAGGVLFVLSKGNVATLGTLAFGKGDAWVVLAAVGWALYTVLGKRRPLPPLPETVRLAALIGGGALVLAPFAAWETASGTVPDFGDARLYLCLCFLAIVPSLGAYFFFDRLVGLVGPAGASAAMYLVPLYAALAAWPLLGEMPQAFHAAGFGLILAGVMLASAKRQ